MKKVKYSIIIIIIVAIVIITITLLEANKNEVQLKKYITSINESREDIINSSDAVDMSKYTATYIEENTVISDEKIRLLIGERYIPYRYKNKEISYEEAAIDIDYAFEALKYSYGAYEYFGGDKVFNKAKEACLESLKEKEKITYDNIGRELFNSLEYIITDGHFSVNGNLINMDKNLINVFNTDYYFYLDDKRYYTIKNNEKYFITEVDGDKEFECYMKQSIDKNGKLCYVLGEMSKVSEYDNCKEITLVDNKNNEIKEKIDLKSGYMNNKQPELAYEEYYIDGIPVLDINRMYRINDYDNSLEMFMESGSKYKNEPLLIIDLRGNLGGSDYYSVQWLKNYLGDYVVKTQSNIQKRSKLHLAYDIRSFEERDKLEKYEEELLRYYYDALENKEFGIWRNTTSKGKFIKNNNLIFVLIDRNVASASEGFVDYLRYIENVVFVGENTRGCSLVTNRKGYRLPNSKVSLEFGDGILIGLEGENIDGKGYEPDIWIQSSDSLDYILRLIDEYKLK